MSTDNQSTQLRREKLAALREHGNAFPNDFRRDALAAELHANTKDQAQLAAHPQFVKVAGRLMLQRRMGKVCFAHIQDMSGQIQLFIQRDALLPEVYNNEVKKYDIGDIIAAEGELFYTKTGELSVRVENIRLLTKSLHPLPEKYRGLADTEIKYRQRYLDLIMSADTREVFRIRSGAIQFIRTFLCERGFLEVETPMMHPIPGGALARPFSTHHNALDMDLFLRIAPELYLKRLVVGGLERVFEINRNFRNEGVSSKHNPEFTMLEFYWAYVDYQAMMDITEEMLRDLCYEVHGSAELTYQGQRIDFVAPFAHMSLAESVLQHNPTLNANQIDSLDALTKFANKVGIEVKPQFGVGRLQMEIFEKTVEEKLLAPTFITAYPVEVSPLSRRSDTHPELSERFELFIGGREIANGFSELNDPEDQAERFRKQVAESEANQDETMSFDEDYIRALEYGLPPTAGEGIGIDRLVMLLTDSPSIRDVLLFPLMRREAEG